MIYLDLPQVPSELYIRLCDACRNIPFVESSRQWLNDFHSGELNVADHQYWNENTTIHQSLKLELDSLYQQFFPSHRIDFTIGRISCVEGTQSTSPPHCDLGRKIAINYLLETGGSQVATCFYKEQRSDPDLTEAENKHYRDLTLDYKIIFPEKQWHCFDVQTYHSVEGIESHRCLLSILLLDNLDLDQFLKSYPHLVK